jgi:hypothetical protein
MCVCVEHTKNNLFCLGLIVVSIIKIISDTILSPALPPSVVCLTLSAGHHVEVGGMTSKKI